MAERGKKHSAGQADEQHRPGDVDKLDVKPLSPWVDGRVMGMEEYHEQAMARMEPAKAKKMRADLQLVDDDLAELKRKLGMKPLTTKGDAEGSRQLASSSKGTSSESAGDRRREFEHDRPTRACLPPPPLS